MKKLRLLKDNPTIGIIAPASSDNLETMNMNIASFKKNGFNVKLSPNLYNKNRYLSASDKERAQDLMDMFIDKSIDAIICYRGGYGSIRMMPYINFNIVKSNPKFFCGYSDVTALINYISYKCNFPTFHGPMINSNFSDKKTLQNFKKLLFSKTNDHFYNLNEFNCKYINKKDFKGKLVGGNLTLMCSLMGTPYEINTKNNIVLLEEINESPYVIDRMLSQLILSNKLPSAKAIILGHFTDCNPISLDNSFTFNELIVDKLSSLKIPIIYNFPFGHSYPNITLPIGVQFEFNSKENILLMKDDIFNI